MYSEPKHGKVRHSRRQRKKKKEPENRSSQIKYRNTLDATIFNEMCDSADKDCENEVKEEIVKEAHSKSKRTFKLLRTNERDSKHDVAEFNQYENNKHCCLLPKNIKVETRNRFRCLLSEPVYVERKNSNILSAQILVGATCSNDRTNDEATSPSSQSLKEREIFHNAFSILIRLGSLDKDRLCQRQISQEETRWQNELKDLIWLELQAYRADMTPMVMDEHLCRQREAVGALLDEIMAYRFDPVTILTNGISRPNTSGTKLNNDVHICPGCLSMHCQDCTRAQFEALKQVEDLLTRLETAEALFPSLQAFSLQYSLYKSSNFIGRIKAMCLWYNMTKHHRLKLKILGRLLTLLHRNKNQVYSSLMDSTLRESKLAQTWDLSSLESSFKADDDGLESWEFYLTEFDRQVYRNYIEDVLKTRGLRKSFNFLERLHTSLLRKARLALEKSIIPSEQHIYFKEEYEGDQELRRYGMWSPEAEALNLPSYRAAFVFLSRVPLDVIHEFLRMRLEQKPEQPSALSVRQLMRELREGLRIACIHRERFAEHSSTAAACEGPCKTLFEEDVQEFDESLKCVFNVYLDYLQQWVQMVQHDSFHKNLISDEWNFVKSIARKINNGTTMASYKFCQIAKLMVTQINKLFIDGPQDLRQIVPNRHTKERRAKFYLNSIGREWQALFDEAREKVVKIIILAKCLRNDIQTFPEYQEVLKEFVDSLMVAVTDLSYGMTEKIIEFQKNVDEINESKSENDLMTLRIRAREILHHAYRMGFEYYKELCKCLLYDERSIMVKDLTHFAFLWMDFVRKYCERGRGLRPRWANHGLEFLILVCDPINTKYLTQEKFDQLKILMDHCISHVIGSTSEREKFRQFHGSRAPSPHCSSRTSGMSSPNSSLRSSKGIDSNQLKLITSSFDDETYALSYQSLDKNCRYERVVLAVRKLDYQIDKKLRCTELIGQVVDRINVDKVNVKVRRVNFTWQRGIKIGHGRFGKVYTIVNNQTGELLAMKEIQLQPGDHRAIQQVAEESQIFEGIQHKNLVRYYGVEIHREEMLIFMEFCPEGTLESLIAVSGCGLPEFLLRNYTYQLLVAVSVLHEHGIAHRDIKMDERRAHAAKAQLCSNCLSNSHAVAQCNAKGRCLVCCGKHHTKLHTVKSPFASVAAISNPECPERMAAHPATGCPRDTIINGATVLLATACVVLQAENGKVATVRALLDSGAEESFISDHIAQLLSLPKRPAHVAVSGVGGTITAVSKGGVFATLKSKHDYSFSLKFSALMLQKLTAIIPSSAAPKRDLPHLEDVTLADPHFDMPGRIDCVLSSAVYAAVLRSGIQRGNSTQPTAINTVFGWVLMGPVATDFPEKAQQVSTYHTTVDEQLSRGISQFWEIEETPSKTHPSPDEEACYDFFRKTTTRNSKGRFVVRIPFKTTPTLGDTKGTAETCFKGIERRFARQPELATAYRKFMAEYEKLGHMEVVVDKQGSGDAIIYLPHHPVIKSAEEKSIRVVFNASKTDEAGRSANSFMHTGSKL